MKALILIALLLTFTACFSSAGTQKKKLHKEFSESSKEHLKPSEQTHLHKTRKQFAKFGQASANPHGNHRHHGSPRYLHNLLFPHRPHGPSPRRAPTSKNVINPSSQAPLATSSAPPTANTKVSAASTSKITGFASSTTAPSTLQPKATTYAAAAGTAPPPDAGTAPVPEAATAPVPDAGTAPPPDARAVPPPDAGTAPAPDASTVPPPDADNQQKQIP